jgi:hypothetical protein
MGGAVARPSVFQAGHIPSCGVSCECHALSPVADACRWLLLLLSAAVWVTTRTVQGMARFRSGQAPAWPLSSDRSVRRGSGVKRDFACTLTGVFPPVLVALRAQSRLGLEGRARILSGPSPDPRPACKAGIKGRGSIAAKTVSVRPGPLRACGPARTSLG